MNSKILEIKFYEVTSKQEHAFIDKLRRVLFPHARNKKDWEIVTELFSWLTPGKFEMPFQDVMLKTQHGKIDVKKLVRDFRSYPIHFQNEWNPSVIALNLHYKFLFDGTLEPFRLAHKYYERLREVFVKEMKPNTRSSYKFEELAEKLELKPNEDFENSVRQLCEIGVLSCHGCEGNVKDGQIYAGVNTAEDFKDWYLGFLSSFRNILERNKQEFWESIPVVSWLMKPSVGNGGLSALMGGEINPSDKVSKVLQVLVFVFFTILLSLAIFCGKNQNWTACSIFSAAAVSLLVVMINKMV